MPLSEFPLPAQDAPGNEPPEIRVVPPGPLSRAAVARLEKVECPAYGSVREGRAEQSGVEMAPIVLATGRGSNVFDADGNRYVDLAAGFGSVLLGHSAKNVMRALEGQSDRLTQALGDVYSADTKIALLERLVALHPGESPRVLLATSGGDAVTAAIKTAMLATGRPGLCAFEGAYHGLGYGPLPACGLRPSYRAPFAPQLNTRVTFAPYPRRSEDLDRSLSAVDAALAGGEVGAVLLEPVLGRGGCVVPPKGFVRQLHELAHRHGALVVADEIWTALGRAGSMLRTREVLLAEGGKDADLDIVCLGKGLGGGLPVSACVAPEPIMQAWARVPPVVHTSTHAGWPLACATAVATIDTLRFRKLPERATEMGQRALADLLGALAGKPGVVEVRGVGLMIGIELDGPERALRACRQMLERGYLLLGGGVRGETLTLTPALTIEEDLLGSAASALADCLDP